MHWNAIVLTKMGSVVNQSLRGSRQEVMDQIKLNGLDIISIHADFKKCIQDFLKQHKLSASVLSGLFKDFSRCLKSGLSVQEAIASLNEHASNPLLKTALHKINVSVMDGHSVKNAFENTKVFPSLVLSSLDAAERSGNLVEVAHILSEYFKIINQNKVRLIKSLVYPISVFIALTVASIVISIKLVPQLSSVLPSQSIDQWPAKLIIGYAYFTQAYGWLALLGFFAAGVAFIKIWEYKRDRLILYVFSIPFIGPLIKEMEFTVIFLNLYVHQKSGMNIIASLTNICSNRRNYITGRLKEIKIKVNQGYSLGEALKTDDFFPSFICMNVKKGESTGNLYQYFYEIYQYYDQRSRDSIEALIALINPALLTLAVSYLVLIIYCFILPLYSSMSGVK
jgi:type II secretory pathway component PulF